MKKLCTLLAAMMLFTLAGCRMPRQEFQMEAKH